MADHTSQNSTSEPTVIGAVCRITGDLTMEGDVVVLGRIDGTVEATGAVHIGPDASVNGGVCGAAVEVDGHVCGDVAAEGAIQLRGRIEGNVYSGAAFEMCADAALVGDLHAATISANEGASYRGHVVIGPDAAAEAQADRREQAGEDRQAIDESRVRDEAGDEVGEPAMHAHTDSNGANGVLRRRPGLLSRSGAVRA